jgi:hypothetical protein
MAKINFDSIVQTYIPDNETRVADSSGIGLRAIGYRAGALVFRGRTAAVQVPANYKPGHVDVALFELQGDDGVDYHCLTQTAGRLSVMTTGVADVEQRSDGGLHLPTIGLMVAGDSPHSFSRIGMVRLDAIPLVPEYPPAPQYAGTQAV